LQKELKIFHVQMRDFDKVKTLLEEEIHRLREQNRIFRSELGLARRSTKENSINKILNQKGGFMMVRNICSFAIFLYLRYHTFFS
jgi:hypothetical protein